MDVSRLGRYVNILFRMELRLELADLARLPCYHALFPARRVRGRQRVSVASD